MMKVCEDESVHVHVNSHINNVTYDQFVFSLLYSNINIAWQTHTERTISTLEMNLVSSFPKPFVRGIME